MDKLVVIKIGGNIIDDEKKLSSFLHHFSSISEKKILVHGGGKLATQLAEQLHIPQQIIEGRRITDADSLKVVTMVYAGFINKNIVAQLQSQGCNAIGLSGADGNLIQAHKRLATNKIDYGFAGDIDAVNSKLFETFLNSDLSPVIAPITHDINGQLLNTNADTIAQEIAKSMSSDYDVILIYCFEKNGVLSDPENENSVISQITPEYYEALKKGNTVFAGMIPKLDNAFAALKNGVHKVIIGKAEDMVDLLNGEKGTRIINE